MMKLYSGIICPFSHRCRIVLHAKGMEFVIQEVDIYNKPKELAELNPYDEVPVLVDRELKLHESNIINEYLDERFPHPQLMPGDPTMRAQCRLILYKLEKELFKHVRTMELKECPADERKKAKEAIHDLLMSFSPTFEQNWFVMGNDYTLVDVALAPLLWRLDHYGIRLANTAAPLLKYAERMFQQQSFIDSLTPAEKAMRR